jgi:hypothetical protein
MAFIGFGTLILIGKLRTDKKIQVKYNTVVMQVGIQAATPFAVKEKVTDEF